MSTTLLVGDCQEILATLEPGSVHCCVTSPPYWGLRDYGHPGQLGLEKTPDEYVARMVEVFRRVRRVLRDDGTLWLNLGDSYAASPSGKCSNDSMRTSTLSGGKSTGRRAHDDTARISRVASGMKAKDLCGIPWQVALALRSDGWWLRSDIIWSKPNPMPESVTDRPTKAHEYLFLLSKSAEYYYDGAAIREPMSPGSEARYAYTFGGPKSIAQTAAEADGAGTRTHPIGDRKPGDGRNKRTVWEIATEPYDGAHFAVMPTALVKPCIEAGSPLGGTVLDPFGGSGTVGAVASDLGRNSILIELNPAYAELAKKRTRQESLFARTGSDVA